MLALKFALCALVPVLALLYVLLSDINRPTVVRPPTKIEQQQVTQAQTGWGKAFTDHK